MKLKHFFTALLALLPVAAFAQATPPKIDTGDTAWVLTSTALVLLMTPGLAFFYAGMVRTKSVVSTLFHNMAALGVIGVLWAICGYTLSFDPTGSSFIGGMKYFFLNGVGADPQPDYAATIPHSLFMLFQCMFAVITPILISGTLAERVNFKGFLAFIAVWSLVVYAPVAHWVWGVGGFLHNMGALDFAGGMVVHMTAGFSALMCAFLIKKRTDFGRKEIKAYDTGYVMLGTTLLWFGWFGFNSGSALASNGLAASAFGNTFFASAAAFVTWMVVDTFRRGKPSAVGAGVGAVAGLVAVTPASGFVTFGAALVIGILAGSVCNFAAAFVKEKMHLDDSLDVFACHGIGGLLGVISTAIFATKTVNSAGNDGAMYGNPGLLTTHLIGAASVIAISMIGTFVAYKIVDVVIGMRVTEKEENDGLDSSQHDEYINSNFTPSNNHPTSHSKVG